LSPSGLSALQLEQRINHLDNSAVDASYPCRMASGDVVARGRRTTCVSRRITPREFPRQPRCDDRSGRSAPTITKSNVSDISPSSFSFPPKLTAASLAAQIAGVSFQKSAQSSTIGLCLFVSARGTG
jgi:hypothetical protein